jgi:bifunctional non-homologous end joining protein LigD
VSRTIVEVAGRKVPLSNLEKVLYPACGFTKAQVLDYVRRIAPHILPHLKDRALTLKRYPDGVAGDFFYEKRCPSHRPPWVDTAQIAQGDGGRLTFCVINGLPALIWAANLASLELHVPLSRVHSPETPDVLVFDLDPGEPAGILECAQVALTIRELLSRMGLVCCVKTSGMKGLHVYVPLNRPETTFDDTKTFSRAVAGILQKHYPNRVTARPAKTDRAAKVFINWSQNDASKTMVCVYSLRARERPVVSFPLRWEELDRAAGLGDPGRLQVEAPQALSAAASGGDRFREVLETRQKLPHL